MKDAASPSSHAAPSRAHFAGFGLLALLSLALAWLWMWHISEGDRWYRNTDMNAHNIADALCLNSGVAPATVDQPASPTKFLLAFDFRVRNEFGLLPVWTVKRFSRSDEPFRDFARLVHVGRVHHRLLVIGLILSAAGLAWSVTRSFDLACFSIVLLCGSSGLLFHGLLLRPELLCVWCGGIGALHCAWLASVTPAPAVRTLWLFLSGICLGLAVLSKLPAQAYFAFILAWCCLAPLCPGSPGSCAPAPQSDRRWAVAIGVAVAGAILLLLASLNLDDTWLDPVATPRIRAIAMIVGLLPLVAFADIRTAFGRYIVGRLLDLSLLLAGMVAAYLGWFGLLHSVLPAPEARAYMGKILNLIYHPEPTLQLFTRPGGSHLWHEALHFLLETPLLYLFTVPVVIGLCLLRSAPSRLRAFAQLLLVQGLGMALLLSKRQFFDQYSIFPQVSLLLAGVFGLAVWKEWWQQHRDRSQWRWPLALAASGTFFLVLTVTVELGPKYDNFHADAAIPVDGYTITFLYDHDVHPHAYTEAMKKHFPTREAFTEALNRYLADPANRQ